MIRPTEDHPIKEFMTISMFAARCKVSPQAIRKAINETRIKKFIAFNGLDKDEVTIYLIHQDEIMDYMFNRI